MNGDLGASEGPDGAASIFLVMQSNQSPVKRCGQPQLSDLLRDKAITGELIWVAWDGGGLGVGGCELCCSQAVCPWLDPMS